MVTIGFGWARVVRPLFMMVVLGAACSNESPGGAAAGGSTGLDPERDAAAPASTGDDAAIGGGRDLRIRDAEPYQRPDASPNVVTGQTWVWTDVGVAAAEKGSLRFGPMIIQALAGGAGLDGAADSFGFLADKLHGDGDIVARIRSLQMTDPRSTAGVMIRADGTPGAASVFLGILADPARGGRVVVRRTAGAAAVAMAPDAQLRAGQFLRIRRTGRHFTFYRSADRLAWVQLGAVDLDLPIDVQAGLAVSAGKAAASTTAEIDQLRLLEQDGPALAAGYDLEPLYLGLGARGSMAGGDVALSANGDVFVTTAELGTALVAPIAGAQTVTARIDALGTATTPKARVGLTFREGGPGRMSPLGRHVMISLDAAGKVSFQRRDRLTNFEAGAQVLGLKPPLWLRLVRYDDPGACRTGGRGLYSSDGINFTTLDTVEIPLADPMMVGVLASSGDQKVQAPVHLAGYAVTPTTTVIEAPPPPDAGAAPDAAGPKVSDGGGAGS
jgi:hypothetical protein